MTGVQTCALPISTLAYQGYGQGADKDFIRQLIGLVGLIPDLTLMLEVSPATSASRLRSRGQASDRYERLDEAFHARVAAGFAEIAAAEPNRCVRIDANGDAAPIRVIAGPKTMIKNPTGVFADLKNQELWVANFGSHSATVFPFDANGNATPKRIIRSGPPDAGAPMLGNPHTVAFDTKRNEVLVAN